ncbi:MAG: hypothetical protein H0X41_08180, partial [Chitinophagaceae bacterium]|nr:hypothetical protein [Chitinophagaceae bacterium]
MRTSPFSWITRLVTIAFTLSAIGCHESPGEDSSRIIGNGKMPNLAADSTGKVYITYGNGDSILCSHSTDAGKTFFAPELVSVLPDLVDYSMRGPQIALLKDAVLITACNKQGDIFSFTGNASGKWSQAVKVNDIDTVAKEGLMALGADGDH